MATPTNKITAEWTTLPSHDELTAGIATLQVGSMSVVANVTIKDMPHGDLQELLDLLAQADVDAKITLKAKYETAAQLPLWNSASGRRRA